MVGLTCVADYEFDTQRLTIKFRMAQYFTVLYSMKEFNMIKNVHYKYRFLYWLVSNMSLFGFLCHNQISYLELGPIFVFVFDL